MTESPIWSCRPQRTLLLLSIFYGPLVSKYKVRSNSISNHWQSHVIEHTTLKSTSIAFPCALSNMVGIHSTVAARPWCDQEHPPSPSQSAANSHIRYRQGHAAIGGHMGCMVIRRIRAALKPCCNRAVYSYSKASYSMKLRCLLWLSEKMMCKHTQLQYFRTSKEKTAQAPVSAKKKCSTVFILASGVDVANISKESGWLFLAAWEIDTIIGTCVFWMRSTVESDGRDGISLCSSSSCPHYRSRA